MGGRSSGTTTTTTSKKKKSESDNNNNSKNGGREIPFTLSSRITLGKRQSPSSLLKKQNTTEKFENAFHSVLLRDDVLSPRECAAIAEVCSTRYRLATSRGPKFGEAWRKNNRLSFVDEKFAKMLWEDVGLKTMFIGGGGEQFHSLNENFRVYEYTQSHHFGPHIDERVRKTSNRGEKLVSTHTMLLYLAGEESGLRGGNTYFLDEHGNRVFSVTPKMGRACFFRHGEEKCEHEGEEIFAGKKIVLRSDVFKVVE
jgi:hypothetical protein